ncbi:maleylacetoacetate isomerase [Brevundimonas sp. 3P9-tot-E]|jgi:maleylpyruvate isomerase|uniref:maleylacetoacetate isomerase n=1 Tax=Brevundimonas TaxID=41275 RepID=UPI00190571A1|nr:MULTISPECIES: maleylacetoacetate isomerase [Brevundimonas]MBK1970219.1 maleylacetoacetate isomerase [Brevundimonas diminuta]MBK1976368.1 maleylacetoacetate isomerase [Brevundimonas diminuta]MDA1323045.1 maleylacetoacetate isomerase [Pseudomonadota bacterium]MDM8352515.1 maleylacetoacetate isomerase [Brevundimonas diminuta]
MILHGYWRSGTSYRTRIALNLKRVEYRQAALDLRTGAQKSDAYLRLNPQGLVPALETGDGLVLTQSPAILEWLEETHPEPPLLPRDAAGRAQVRAMAAVIGCDIHPLNNLRVLKAVRGLGADQAGVDAWAGQWIIDGFTALEALVVRHGEGWCFGGAPTLADCYLMPQLYSARRFNVDLAAFPRLLEIEARAEAHPAFIAALPENQPDAD